MSRFSDYEYRNQPGFDMNPFEGANQAIPMKTLVIHCFDPRAVEIPQAVAEYFGTRSIRVKTFSTNLAIGLATHEHYLPRLTRVDAPPSL
jgi:hypothetical protein